MTIALRNTIGAFFPDNGANFDLPSGASHGNNPGLALNRYLAVQSTADRSARTRLLSQIAERAQPSGGYKLAHERWKGAVSGLPGTVQQRMFRVQGRMIVGYGAESVLEASIALNQPWGMPYIPG